MEDVLVCNFWAQDRLEGLKCIPHNLNIPRSVDYLCTLYTHTFSLYLYCHNLVKANVRTKLLKSRQEPSCRVSLYQLPCTINAKLTNQLKNADWDEQSSNDCVPLISDMKHTEETHFFGGIRVFMFPPGWDAVQKETQFLCCSYSNFNNMHLIGYSGCTVTVHNYIRYYLCNYRLHWIFSK